MNIFKIGLSLLLCVYSSLSATQTPYLIYSPGFGGEHKNESTAQFYCKKFFVDKDNFSITRYSDAAGCLHNAVFYTQPAVYSLACELYDKIIAQDHTSLLLVGFSRGAATIINCLAELCNTKEHNYFNNTCVTTTNMPTIIDALNNGALVLSSPLLHMRKVKAIQATATACELILITTFFSSLYCTSSSYLSMPSYIKKCLFVALGFLAHKTIGIKIKNACTHALIHKLLPYITYHHFNPLHPSPLENVKKLRGRLTCPILLHFHLHDGVLDNPDEDIIRFYDAIKNDTTHIIITTDAWHKQHSLQWSNALTLFQKHYFPQENDSVPDKEWTQWCKKTQPTTQELRTLIKDLEHTCIYLTIF